MNINDSITSLHYFIKQAKLKPTIDIDSLDTFSFSAIMRQLNKKYGIEDVENFLKIYKKSFDTFADESDCEDKAIKDAVKKFNKISKEANLSEHDINTVANHLVNIVDLLVQRIKPENRFKAKESIKKKLRSINALDVANKKMPPSSAIGQSIGFIKNILFSRHPEFVRLILNSVVQKL